MFRIKEIYTNSKSGNQASNEDGFLITDDFIAVIDGATSKNNEVIDGKTGGQIIRDLIIEAIKECSGDEDSETFFVYLQRYIAEKAPVEKYGHISASIAVCNIKNNQIWAVGDCQIMKNGIDYTKHKEIDRVLASARSAAIHACIKKGMSIEDLQEKDIGREIILPILKMQYVFENSPGPYGYWVINNSFEGGELPKEQVSIVPFQSGDTIILATDGYPVLYESLSDCEDALAKIIQNDPLCYKDYLSTKGINKRNVSYDDRTFISVIIE